MCCVVISLCLEIPITSVRQFWLAAASFTICMVRYYMRTAQKVDTKAKEKTKSLGNFFHIQRHGCVVSFHTARAGCTVGIVHTHAARQR